MKRILFLVTVTCLTVAFAAGAEDTKAATRQSAVHNNSSSIRVRYFVNDIESAVAFYTNNLQFHVTAQSGPYFAILERNNLQLVLSPPKGPGGASQPMPDGRRPEPGGWNRIILPTSNLEQDVDTLKKDGVKFRNNIVSGPGGREILLEDPSGNPIELFQATR
jgi:predicted enzyme related to lactoylglutathione lyase